MTFLILSSNLGTYIILINVGKEYERYGDS